MIRISLGNVGSGKTVAEVREIFLNRSNRKTYTNIITEIPHQITIKSDMIIKKELLSIKKNGEPVNKFTLNTDFWRNIKEPINVVIDEAHSMINARRSMSKTNELLTQWLALIRRVLGESDGGYGELVLITQLHNRIDVIAREMATQVRYHRCHYIKVCKNCGNNWQENSDFPETIWYCPGCGNSEIIKTNHVIEVYKFQNMKAYEAWKFWGEKTFFSHYLINDIEDYFCLYDTFQWENLFEDLY